MSTSSTPQPTVPSAVLASVLASVPPPVPREVSPGVPPAARAATAPIRLGGLVVRFLIEGDETRGGLAMFEFDVAPGAKVPAAHSHDAYEETLYALRGCLTWTVDGARFELTPGQCAVIPRGAVHRFENVGDQPATTLTVVTPGVLGPSYFHEIAAVLAAAHAGPPDVAAVADVMRRHGLTPA
jgi:quercetin dioxygenase-like cupin family protein